jgi:putative ABC transport system ATP-binding protein
MAIIECENLRKTYRIGTRTVEALRGATLRIDDPGFYAIMGQSGSGKSTLLHLLAGLDESSSGTVSVSGQRLDAMDDRTLTEFRRTKIGVIFQQFNLIPTMTARENVELPGMLARTPAEELTARSSELLDQLGIGERADHRPEALSGGEQQRVAIARSLLFSPAVIFADEPTGNLDSANAEQLWALLASLAEHQQITVVMVTHEPSAAAHCKRTYLLRDGVVSGTIETGAMDATDIAAEYQRLSRSA